MNQLIQPAKEFLSAVLKKDGVLGVLLVMGIVVDWQNDKRTAQRFDKAYELARLERKELTDSLIALNRYVANVAATSVEVIRTNSVLQDNTRTVLRRFARTPRQRDDG